MYVHALVIGWISSDCIALSFVLIVLLVCIQTDSNFICTFSNDISNCTVLDEKQFCLIMQ